MPVGIEIRIATDKLKATMINEALIFLLATFLNALVTTPKLFSPFEPALILSQLLGLP